MPLAPRNSERTDKILQAAAQLFARQGYHGTSTREIARLADVSENTLFRHFDHKEDLFWSALRSRSTGLKLRRDLLDGITGGDDPEVVLPKIIDLLVDTVIFKPELLRLIAVAFLELHWKTEAFCQEFLSPIFSAINRYVEMNIANERVRNLDPTMVTAALVTTVMTHAEISRLIDGDRLSYPGSREAASAYTKFWLDVLTPRPVPLQRPATRTKRASF
ncbi:MAG: TetR/AcrR family transcriptional regulator [Terracidiphilus sp.]